MSQHLFLFAHQDDEVPVFLEIETLCARGERVLAAYLTSGTLDGSHSTQRNAESRRVLERLGVAPTDIAFLGSAHQLPDGRLAEHLDSAKNLVLNWLEDKGPVDQLFCLAWEGGHQDHDALYALAVQLHTQHAIAQEAFQFPYYHGKGLPGSWFKVVSPIPENGPALRRHIPWESRRRYLGWCLSAYPSQFKTWIGLGPFFAFHYLFKGTQVLQKLQTARVNERPHKGPLLYERRGFYRFESLRKILNKQSK
jgi:LmbE family N-acetylglucosaminyl deacetylase